MSRGLRALELMLEDGYGQPAPAAAPGFLPDRIEPDHDQDAIDPWKLRVAKRFIEIVGGADMARDLVDRVADLLDNLGMTPNEDEPDDSMQIAAIGAATPELPGLPPGGLAPAGFSIPRINPY